ncbi:MAG: ABC transporter ATP-binding protein [Microbacteriaceae bacterium]|nr:ABC transporter ATP-binding protein [Microbacteriaceae bacterium]
MTEAPVFMLQNAERVFRSGRGQRATETAALRGINLTINRGERVAIVGESGSGKTTLLRVLLGLEQLTGGSYHYRGAQVVPGQRSGREVLRRLRSECGVVFQDPYTSFNPFLRVGTTVIEPALASGAFGRGKDAKSQALQAAGELAAELGLQSGAMQRYPHEFSGGQRQRLALCRALLSKTQALLCDEPVSALDAATRQQFLLLLQRTVAQLCLTTVTVTHDLAIVPEIADRAIVLFRGEIAEAAPVPQLFASPQHPYTQRLLHAASI